MPATAIDRFAELETRIVRAIDVVKTARKEKETFERDLAVAQQQISRLEYEIEELKQERDLVKNRVESLLQNLDELIEGPIA